jgi:hypothetical protein
MTEVLAGGRIRAADLNRAFAQVTPYDVLKVANEDISNSATYQNDNELAFPVEANRDYRLEVILYYSTLNSADIKIQWTGPASCTFAYAAIDVSTTDTTAVSRSTASGIDYGLYTTTSSPYGARAIGALHTGGGTPIALRAKIEATISVGANSGTFQLQWAQNAAVVTTTTVLANSWLRRTELVLT